MRIRLLVLAAVLAVVVQVVVAMMAAMAVPMMPAMAVPELLEEVVGDCRVVGGRGGYTVDSRANVFQAGL